MADKSMRNAAAPTATAAVMQPMPGMNSQSLLRFDPNFETFANHLSMSTAVIQRMKFPPWLLFPLVYTRKDQAKLPDSEKQRFLCAFDVLNQNGVLGQFVETHGQPAHRMHHTLRFL